MLILGDRIFLAKRKLARAILTRSPSRNLFSFPQLSPTFPNFPQTKKRRSRPKNHQKKSWQEILSKTQTNATEFQCMRFPNFPQRSPNQKLLATARRLDIAAHLLDFCGLLAWFWQGFAWEICLGYALARPRRTETPLNTRALGPLAPPA